MQTKSKILSDFFSENKPAILSTFLVSLFSNIFTIIIPVSIGKFYNLVFGLNTHRSRILNFLPEWFWDTAPRFLMFFMTLVILKIVFDFLRRYQVGSIGEKMLLFIRNKLFLSQLQMPMQIYDEKGIGKYLLRHSGDLKSTQNYVTKGLIGFLVDMLLLALVLITIGILDSGLLLVMLGFFPVFGGLIFLLNRALHDKSLAQRNYKSGLLSFVNATLRSILSVKAFNRLQPEMNRYKLKSEKVYRAGIRYHQINSVIMAVIPGLLYVMLFAILYYTYYQYEFGEARIDAGSLLAAILLLVTAMPVFRRALRVNTVWELGNISFKKLLIVLNHAQEQEESSGAFRFKRGKIVFQGVTFQYSRADKKILFDDFVISSGEMTSIQGRTGAGKTTLLKLFTGLYLPATGKIFFDDQDTSHVNKKSLRKAISLVPEDWPFFGRTVFEAISYSRKSKKRSEAGRVLDLIQKNTPKHLKLTLDTRIGDLGANLSKGQKKLLAYARALLTAKPIIIIDEPFSGLDKSSRHHVAELINNLKGKKTVIILDQDPPVNILNIDHSFSIDRPVPNALGTE
ncbi:ABC transporter ATP-binding protein [Fulvivirgaceae bacterium BMA12]|uniref:ABC transporter ATP-binding protein n=1 Tax=Agaribacillus aureus TaxID=3051825 RepID=A0ABT8L0T0_9BACT|nr:ABC transporter ATP-binding protein [Fulvivirgaceae bacterium BMA12]